MVDTAPADRDMLARLRRALEADAISPWFQPVMDPSGTEMLSAEALPRLHDPEVGVIAPVTFLTVAERNGLLAPIGEVLLLKTCRAFAEWRARGIAPKQVSINLTGAEMQTEGVVERILNALDQADIAPGNLAIELAESVSHEPGSERALAAIRRLSGLGVGITADDLGTDRCDPDNLARMHATSAKVDRSIVMRLGEEDEAAETLERLADMTRAMGIPLVAKGVETRIQIDMLVACGCAGQQGFAIARPMPEDSFTEWLDLNTGWDADVA